MNTPNDYKNSFHRAIVCLLTFCALIASQAKSLAEIRLGSPDIRFERSAFDPDFPQMREWARAGVEGGIPPLADVPERLRIDSTDSAGLNRAIAEVAAAGGGQLSLKPGVYKIDATVQMANNVRVVGLDEHEVVLEIDLLGQDLPAFLFQTSRFASLERLTIRGGHGTPEPGLMENEKPEFRVNSVVMRSGTRNCWLNKVRVIDSGNHPIAIWNSYHITLRDSVFDGSWNKGGGGSGYVQLAGGHALMVGCTVRNVRHLALQKEHCTYNVVFRNRIEQDVNFHDRDLGNNLIEQNDIVLPKSLPGNWHALMGPWSHRHAISKRDNYIFRNRCVELNNGRARVFSDSGAVYLGPRAHQQEGGVFVESRKLPVGGTFYPVLGVPAEE